MNGTSEIPGATIPCRFGHVTRNCFSPLNTFAMVMGSIKKMLQGNGTIGRVALNAVNELR
jgi:hypothetical protein